MIKLCKVHTKTQVQTMAKARGITLTVRGRNAQRRYKSVAMLCKELAAKNAPKKAKKSKTKPKVAVPRTPLRTTTLVEFKGHRKREDLLTADELAELWGDELAAVIDEYTTNSRLITQYARKGVKKGGAKQKYDLLLKAINMAPRLPRATVVYRGFEPNSASGAAREGDVFVDRLSGWSRDPRISLYFSGRDTNCCLHRLSLPKGTRALDTMTNEEELVLGPHKFRIIRISEASLPKSWQSRGGLFTVMSGAKKFKRALRDSTIVLFDLAFVE